MSVKNRWVLLGILVGLLLTVFYVMFLLFPSQERIREVRESYDSTMDQVSSQQMELASLQQVRENEPTIVAELAAFDAFLPRERSVGRVFEQLHDAAERAFVTVDTFSLARPIPVPDEELALPPLPDDNVLVTYSVQMAFSGDFFEVLEFVRQVESSRVVPQSFSLDSVQMNANEDMETGDLQIQTSLSGTLHAIVPSGEVHDPVAGTEDSEDSESDDGNADEDAEVS